MSWLPFLFQSSILLVLFYGTYWLVLSKETHHKLNRLLLVLILFSVVTIPFLPMPKIALPIQAELVPSPPKKLSKKIASLELLDFETNVVETTKNTIHINWRDAIWYTYLFGMFLVAIRFLAQFISLIILLAKSRIYGTGMIYLAESDRVSQPFSFFNIIFLSTKVENERTQDQILQHETIHAEQWHSIDIILSELFAIVFWFHPLAAHIKRAVRLNLEYIVDAEMLHSGINRKQYQYSLLQVSTGTKHWYLSNNFNQSFIKKRIIMMNNKKSSDNTKLKYLFFLPIFLCSYGLIGALQAQDTPKEAIKAFEKAQQKKIEAELKAVEAQKAYEEARVLMEQSKFSEEKEAQLEKELLELEALVNKLEEKSAAIEGEREALEDRARAIEEEASEMEDAREELEDRARALEEEAEELRREMEELDAEERWEEEAEEETEYEEENLEKHNIYVVIRSNLTRQELRDLQKDIQVFNISVDFPELEYNSNNEITRIKMTYRTADGNSGNAISYNKGAAISEPLVFYRIAGEPHEYSIGVGITKDIERGLRETMRNMNGYFFGNFH